MVCGRRFAVAVPKKVVRLGKASFCSVVVRHLRGADLWQNHWRSFVRKRLFATKAVEPDLLSKLTSDRSNNREDMSN